jgi:transmembrane sensor
MALADAVAEFNRYNVRKIVIEDESVASIRISGKFRATQFEAFVRLLEDGFPIRARSTDDRILLTDSREIAATAAQ